MKYSYRYIIENRRPQNANWARKIGDKYVLMTVISKALSPVPVYVFLNIGLHPDTITLASFFFVILSFIFFIGGNALLAVLAMLIFALLDSVDGDMARCTRPTKYGGILDSFGADLFYALMPLGVGYYLFSKDVAVIGFSPVCILLVSALVSLSFILYRLINTKVLKFRQSLNDDSVNHSAVAKDSLNAKGLVRLLEWYRHVLLRGNFFSEPGLIFWFAVLLLLNADSILAWYLVAVLLYNLGYLLTNFVGAYVFFKSIDKVDKSNRII
ncbi:MAG: CDP-alcohol phosphatidyltransferase family protein [Patescibacteria group bacterium]